MFKKTNEAQYWKEYCHYLSLKLSEKERENQSLTEQFLEKVEKQSLKETTIKRIEAIIYNSHKTSCLKDINDYKKRLKYIEATARAIQKGIMQLWRTDLE